MAIIQNLTELRHNARNLRANNEFRLVLRPETMEFRQLFRNSIERQLDRSTRHQMPWIEDLDGTEVIDSSGIIELNNSTTSERRVEIMESIRNYGNANENAQLFIATTSNQVRTYLHDLLIRSATNSSSSLMSTESAF